MEAPVLNAHLQLDESLEDGVIIANIDTSLMIAKILMDYSEMMEGK